MEMRITCTQDGVTSYPLHKHDNYEIMFYLQGEGHMRTTSKDYAFSPGSIIIVPPGITHGSTSVNGFKNISVSGRFENLLCFTETVVLSDNAEGEGRMLAAMIYNNRHKGNEYLSKLCSAYVHFILQNISIDGNINMSVNKIVSEITDRFYDSDINLKQILLKSGYAEDYIRAHFKKVTGKTPNEFLTDVRMKRAVFLIEIYAGTLTLEQIAYRCGYSDYVYFSKKFKKTVGESPQKYKNKFRSEVAAAK